MENIGAIITAYRKKAHISQTELVDRLQAEGIEVSQKSVSAWETGRNEVSARIFLHICRILEIPDCLEEYFGSNPKDPLSMLNDEGKQKVLSYIDLLIHPVSYVKETNVIPYLAHDHRSARQRRTRRGFCRYGKRRQYGTGIS